MKSVKVNGIPIIRYKIMCGIDSAECRFVFDMLKRRLTEIFDADLSTNEHSDRTIIVGAPINAPYGEGHLTIENGNITIKADDIAALTLCASYLISLLIGSDDGDIAPSEIEYRSALQSREVYANDTEAFLPVYHTAYSLPRESILLEEKTKVLNDPQGRPFVIAHRCEHVFYPENSLEGVISAWRCGADSAEIDIQRSADGVWMCMHDKEISRTTNADEFLGKDGFPDSALLTNWSFEQLRQLCLKDSFGKLTPFKIPTLTEMLKACDGRIYAHIDKRYSINDDLFPLMEELSIYKCVYFITNVTFNDILSKKDRYADKGVRLDSLPRPAKGQSAEELAKLIVDALPYTTPAIIPVGDYVCHGEKETQLINSYGGKLRIGAWFLRDFDTEELWLRAKAEGVGIFMTNRPMELIQLLTDR